MANQSTATILQSVSARKSDLLKGIIGGFGILALYIIQLQNFLLFHSLVELASILVSFALFIVVWNAREQLDNAFLAVLGIAYLFIGGLDLLHTLAYSGMGVFPSADANLPTQLWIFSRYMEATSLVGAGVVGYASTQKGVLNLAWEKRGLGLLGLGYAGLTGIGLLSIFSWNIFPQAYIEGQGLTQFKIASEYLIMGLLVVALVVLYSQREEFESRVFSYLAVAVLLTIGAEFAFTMYVSVYGLSNAIGHFFKLGSFFLIYLSVVKTGITEPQKTIYRTLAARERDLRQYQQSVESSIDLLSAVDTEFNYLFANERYCEYHGLDPAEVDGKALSEAIGDAEFQRVQDPLNAALQGEQSRLEITRSTAEKGRRIFDVQFFPIFDDEDDIRGVGASMRDITEQKERERELAQFREAVEHTAHTVYITDTDGTIEYVNPAFEAVTGYSEAEAIGKTPRILKSGEHDEAFFEEMWETILSGAVWDRGIINQTKSGELVHMDQTIAPVFDETGDEIERFVAINSDITHIKEYEQRLEGLNEQLTALNRVVRHDIRNDMNVVHGWATLLQDQVDDAESREILDNMKRNVEHVIELTDVAKNYVETLNDEDSIETKPVDLPTVLQQVVDSRAEIFQDASIDIQGEIPAVSIAANEMISSVIRNLINNAVQHNDTDAPEVEVSAADLGSFVEICVSDNGPGISDDQKETIFGKGEKGLESSGTGIGLYLVQKWVSNFDGEVSIEENEPTGTQFTLKLKKWGEK